MIFLLSLLVNFACNIPNITNFNDICYKHTINTNSNCCHNFNENVNCLNEYLFCDLFDVFYTPEKLNECKTSPNLIISKKCHHFSITLYPQCCKNPTKLCLHTYRLCDRFNPLDNVDSCNLPSFYTNNYCNLFTKSISPNCCHNFNDHCSTIYEWCSINNLDTLTDLNYFINPQNILIISPNLTTYSNINLLECASLCLNTQDCLSFNYISETKICF